MEEKITEGIAIKLFDQVKGATDQNTEAVKDLTRIINELIKYIEKQPDLNRMAELCSERKHCLNGIEKKLDDLKGNFTIICVTTKKLLNKVTLMIAVVIVAFALMAMSYFFVRSNIENMIMIEHKHRLDAIKTQQSLDNNND